MGYLYLEQMTAIEKVQSELNKANARTWVVAGLLIALFLVLGSIGWYYHGKHVAKINAELDQSYLTIQDFKVKIQQDGSTLSTIKQVAGSEHAARVLAENEVQRLKNIKSVVKTVFQVKVDSFEVPYEVHDTTYISETGCIPYGTFFSLQDSLKYISGVIGEDNIHIDSLGLKSSSVTVTIADVRRGLFKRSEPSVIVDFSSQYIMPITGQNVIVKQKKKPLLLSRGAMLVYGFILGAVSIR